jgi:hypothetical protein
MLMNLTAVINFTIIFATAFVLVFFSQKIASICHVKLFLCSFSLLSVCVCNFLVKGNRLKKTACKMLLKLALGINFTQICFPSKKSSAQKV